MFPIISNWNASEIDGYFIYWNKKSDCFHTHQIQERHVEAQVCDAITKVPEQDLGSFLDITPGAAVTWQAFHVGH